jgi:uncharacterized membrane protein YesL
LAFKLFDYQSSGKGVSKAAPQKKPFFRYWEIFGRKFWKIIELNLIYVLFCIPVVTFGPATAALTHVMRKFILEQPCFVFDEFFTAFKKNFKQSVFIGIVDVIMLVSLFIALFQYMSLDKLPDGAIVYICIMICCATLVFMMHFYIYLEIVALKLSLKAILKNAIFLVFLGVKRNFIALIVNLTIITLVVLFLPYSVFVVIVFPLAFMSFTTTFICYPIIQKYIINPYYEERGERNPELGITEDDVAENALFVDRGGSEKEIKASPKAHGKVIK